MKKHSIRNAFSIFVSMFRIGEIPAKVIKDYRAKFVELAKNYSFSAVLDSHTGEMADKPFLPARYDLIAGYTQGESSGKHLVRLEDLKDIRSDNDKWYLGYLGYDLKIELEELHSNNPDRIGWPPLFFFSPEILFLVKGETIEVFSDKPETSLAEITDILNTIKPASTRYAMPVLQPSLTKEAYLEKIRKLQEHIHRGDIYEVNFCMEFFKDSHINPYACFQQISMHSPAPFSVFFRNKDHYLLSASPERFLQKENDILHSQPIKGTAPRGTTAAEDQKNKDYLRQSLKERTENIMITDLVRNDLSRIARKKTVEVEELCGIYTYPHVYQMISTIRAQIDDISMYEIIRASFPMGSMTGAPKIRAMQLIEEYEDMKRGLYSGAVGYIAPGMDFDLNVVIRSLQYNAVEGYISYIAGSAITALSDPVGEYEECLLKAYAINQLLSPSQNA